MFTEPRYLIGNNGDNILAWGLSLNIGAFIGSPFAIIATWKFHCQKLEFEADACAAKALIKEGDTETVQREMKKLKKNATEKLDAIIQKRTAFDQNSRTQPINIDGFRFIKHQQKNKFVIDQLSSSTSFWSNWNAHPTRGERYFALKKIVENKA